MDSTHDDTHTTTGGAADDVSKQQFLDALLAAGHESDPSGLDRKPVESDGVALSSNPDPIDLPGAPVGPVRARSESTISPNKPEIMYSIEKNSNSDDADEPVVDEAGGTDVADEQAPGVDANLLLLSCPKCDGQLALREEHIGVEGACVWCEAPIIAARAGTDRTVKVFVIATETQPKAEAPAATPSEPEVDEVQPSPVQEPADSFQPEEPTGFTESDMATGWGAPAPTESVPDGVSEFSTGAIEEPTEATAEFDSPVPEALAPSIGFGTTPETPTDSDTDGDIFEGFTASAPSSENYDPKESSSPGSGFGEFLSSASGSTEPTSESGPATMEDAPPSEQTMADGFSGPTPWGPPTIPAAPVDESTNSPSADSDVAPAEITAPVESDSSPKLAPANDFAPPIEWGAPDSTSPAAQAETAPSLFTGFGDPALSPPESEDTPPAPYTDEQPGTPPVATTDPEALFSPTPPSQPAPSEKGEEFPVGFNIPSSAPSTSPFPSFEPTDAPPSSFEETATAEVPQEENLPVFEANEENTVSDSGPTPGTASLFGTPTQGSTSLFGPSPEGSDTPAAEAPANPFGEKKPEEESAPEQENASAPEKEAQLPVANAPATPQMESVTLGKKKKGKGFFIITAIVLGLVCGAALASFVLPVDEYVSRARSVMEQKFMPSATWESAENTTPSEQPTATSPKLNN